jgi:hypothetical protein
MSNSKHLLIDIKMKINIHYYKNHSVNKKNLVKVDSYPLTISLYKKAGD